MSEQKEAPTFAGNVSVEPKPFVAKDVSATIQSSIDLVPEYFRLNKEQATSSYKLSVALLIAGALLIAIGIGLFLFRGEGAVSIAALTALGGIVLQIVGGTPFILYSKSLAQLNYYFDKLIAVQEIALAVKLCEQFDSAEKRDAMTEQIIHSLIKQGTQAQRPILLQQPKPLPTIEEQSKV